MSFEIYYTEWVVDLKAISRVLLLQSSNLWVSAAIVVGEKYFPLPDQYESGFAFIPTNLPCRFHPLPLLDFIASVVILQVSSFKAMQV